MCLHAKERKENGYSPRKIKFKNDKVLKERVK